MAKSSAPAATGGPIQGVLLPTNLDQYFVPHKTIRIAVSGDVQLTKLECDIVDTSDFQRLRFIRQLGTAYLVYPTAVHTRFDHSLGTLAVAAIMVRAIQENRHNDDAERSIPQEDEALIRLVALLHDICHIPFGHTIEDEFAILTRHDSNTSRFDRFLGIDSSIGQLIVNRFGEAFYRRFAKIYQTERRDAATLGEDAYIYDLVNNTACADLLDYLRRDSYFCGIMLDMEYRFLKYLYLYQDDGARRVAIRLWKKREGKPRPDILSELVRLLDNRYLLSERVYFHHARLISGAMLADAVLREKLAGRLNEDKLCEIGDDQLVQLLVNSPDLIVRKLGSAVKNRTLWKEFYQRDYSRISSEQSEHRDMSIADLTINLWWADPEQKQRSADFVAQCLGMEAGDLIIYCPPEGMNRKIAEMKVFWNGALRNLDACTDHPVIALRLKTILDSHEMLWAIRAYSAPNLNHTWENGRVAMDMLLTFDERIQRSAGAEFYSAVVARIAAKEKLDLIPHTEYARCAESAIDRLMSQTAETRTASSVEAIIKNAFGMQGKHSTT